jgi:acyl transferase domain-containing protein/acyl carrier protein
MRCLPTCYDGDLNIWGPAASPGMLVLNMDPATQIDRARQVITDLRKRLAETQTAGSDPIAIVGMACRFPGEARDCESYWRMIAGARNAVRSIPAHRALDMAANSLRHAALLDDVERFDAAFFDISPREAAQMDPQQRLFLEVAWEALEDAGQTRARLAGSPTGVFVGIHNHSSGYLELQTADISRINEYTAIGSGHDMIAGRLAYVFDLVGPCAAVNTACSSSLVAVHMACQSVLFRDCRMAVAGGVNLILGPMQTRIVGFGAMLADDGRCKTFDSRANGYGRGEGCGVVVLKRLSDALADRDRVLAIIRSSAVNQDGRTNGLTAPNGLSQQALLRRALARAGLEASRIGYIEAHGTGTALGDPIELEALASVYGVPVEGASRCGLGSAKSNINHLEGAAGIAGLIKAILTLRARVIPPVAGFEQLNPHISLDGTRLFIPTAPVEWKSHEPRVAAVSAFGWSGVNAHVLLEEAAGGPPPGVVRPTMIMVSASDESALSTRALALADALQRLPDEMLESFAWTTTVRRSHYELRLAVAGGNHTELAEALRKAVLTKPIPVGETPLVVGFLIGDDTEVAAALGAELMAENDVFHGAVMACAAAFRAVGEAAISASLSAAWAGSMVVPDRARAFAFAIGVAAVLERWGIRPAAVAGWGAGSLAAVHLSGGMPLAEAARRVARDEHENDGAAAASAALFRAGVNHEVRLDRLSRDGGMDARGQSARSRLMQVLADLAATGANLTWDEVFGSMAQLVSVPAHRFRRRRHWVVEPPSAETATSAPGADTVPGDWFFETVWRPTELLLPATQSSDLFKCLILGVAHGHAERLASLVRGSNGIALVESSDDVDSARVFEGMGRGRWALVDLRALHRRDGTVAAEAMRLARQVVDLDRAFDQTPTGLEVKIWIATQGAHDVLAGTAPDLVVAPLWGLCRSLILDHPERWGGFVDLDPAAAFDPVKLYREIAARTSEAEETAFRSGMRYVNRIVSAPAPAAGVLRLDPAATYLVTGAFGGLGPALAAWLGRCGAKSLVLAGRSLGEDADTHHPSIALREALQEIGVEARLERCDVGDQAAVGNLFEGIRRASLPLRGIFHAAAAAAAPVARIENGDLAAAFRSKVNGALILDQQSRTFDLDYFVLFSSAAGVLGARGQGHYAAANSFLDALAAKRRAEGLPALSIDWGLLGGNEAPHVPYYRRVGLNPMAPEVGFDAMARLMSEQKSDQRNRRYLVASLDGDRLQSALELRGRAPFLSALTPDKIPHEAKDSQALGERVRRMPAALRRGMLADEIAVEVRAVMELAPEDALSFDRGFFDLGMDSLMTVALKARLEDRFDLSLPSTLAMDYPSVAALAGYFEAQLVGSSAVPYDTGFSRVAEAEPQPRSMRLVEELSDDEVGNALAAELRALNLGSWE